MANRFRNHLIIVLCILLIVVFGSGILLGLNLGKSETTLVERFIKDNELTSESYLVEQTLFDSFGTSTCTFTKERLDELSLELGNIGTLLGASDAERTLGVSTYNVLKRRFHLMQIRTYILFYKYDRQCNPEANVILFYYSKNDSQSGAQGIVLDRVVRDHNAKVFALEYNYSVELNFLEQYYNITRTPSLVINYETTLEGFHDYPELSSFMHNAT
jgi:hypothetical protein